MAQPVDLKEGLDNDNDDNDDTFDFDSSKASSLVGPTDPSPLPFATASAT